MAASTLVTIEQYLNTSYRPDVEFIDGELREKPMVQWVHVRLQSLLCAWFDQHEDEWRIIGGPEARTRVSPTRVRLPDIVMIPAGPAPQTLVDPPLIVIEILSPSDSHSELEERMRDYVAMGVPNVWMIDPSAENCARLRRLFLDGSEPVHRREQPDLCGCRGAVCAAGKVWKGNQLLSTDPRATWQIWPRLKA